MSFRPWSLELQGAPATVIAADLDGDRRVRLAHLVDLRGGGRPTLFLAIPDAQGRSQIVAVRRVP